jgi:hypothetical protein
MPNCTIHPKKPETSLHQKQMRFLTGLSLIVCSAFFLALFWLMNRHCFSTF